jgi:hypothetical protein
MKLTFSTGHIFRVVSNEDTAWETSRRCKNNITIDLIEISCGGVDCIHLPQGVVCCQAS